MSILLVGLGAYSAMVLIGFGVGAFIVSCLDRRGTRNLDCRHGVREVRAASDTAPVPPATVPRPVGAPPPRGGGIAGRTHHAFQYDHTDLPPGVTHLDWRRRDRSHDGGEAA